MAESAEEWLRQADYDLETAEYMLQGGRRFYAVFMAHLAVEKALKGLYRQKMGHEAPRTHNLPYLLELCSLQAPDDKQQFLVDLTAAQVASRYAENLAGVQRAFGQQRTRQILNDAKEVVAWIRTQW